MRPKELSEPLYELITSLDRPPVQMSRCKTIYEAVRVSRRLDWPLPIHRASAVSMWTTCALVADDKCRKHMTKLIVSEADGERWIMQIGGAVNAAIAELDRLHSIKTKPAKDRTRTFQQHRDAAVRHLRQARNHLSAIDCRPRLTSLIGEARYELILKAIRSLEWQEDRRQHVKVELARQRLVEEGVPVKGQWAELINRGEYFSDDPSPSLDHILGKAIDIAQKLEAKVPDRHSARGQFLRTLYEELEGTVVSNVRVAFLCHAAQAVFSEPIDKAQVRRLVKDIAEELAERNARLEAVGMGKEWAESFLRELRGDTRLQQANNSRPSLGNTAADETFKQSRSISGRSEKVQHESVSTNPARRSSRTSTACKSSAVARSSPPHRKKP